MANQIVTRAAAFISILVFIIPCARGIDAVYIPGTAIGGNYYGFGGTLEVQGSSARIELRVPFPNTSLGSSFTAYSVAGATGNDTTLYTLLDSTISGRDSVLILNDPHTGAYLGTIQTNKQFSDIACTNGQLYGIESGANSIRIDSISATGTSQTILTQSETAGGTWRLSGFVGGDSLVAAHSGPTGFVINPTTLAVSAISLLPGNVGNPQISEMIINAAGNTVTSVAGFQVAASYPGGVFQEYLPGTSYYGTSGANGVVSDEFNYSYLPSLPAAVHTTWNLSATGEIDGLARTPQLTFSGPVVVDNYVAPDGTTLSNVTATNTVYVNQAGGAPIASYSASYQPAAPGSLTNRPVGQLSVSVNLSNTPRGTYYVEQSSAITADYAYGSTINPSQPVQVTGAGGTQIEYDPVSSNLVGNGDAGLGAAGWEGLSGTQFVSQALFTDQSNHSFDLSPETSFPAAILQVLQLPTANVPMVLSFSYFTDVSSDPYPDDIQVLLNGTLIAEVSASSSTSQTYQATITDPSLENLADATLTFQATTGDPSINTVEVGNISLTAVPEPTIGSLLTIASAALVFRRRPAGKQRNGSRASRSP